MKLLVHNLTYVTYGNKQSPYRQSGRNRQRPNGGRWRGNLNVLRVILIDLTILGGRGTNKEGAQANSGNWTPKQGGAAAPPAPPAADPLINVLCVRG